MGITDKDRVFRIVEIIVMLVAIIGSAVWSYSNLRSDIASLQTEISGMKKNNDELKQDINSMRNQVNCVEGQINFLYGTHNLSIQDYLKK